MKVIEKKITFGLIVGTRGFFNSALAVEGRKDLVELMEKLNFEYVILPQEATPTGAIETLDDAKKCAALFSEHRNEIDGVIVSLPNFGDELGVVNSLNLAKLDVPVLVQACDDDNDKVSINERRDAFCGKLSVCNNLYQYGMPFTDTTFHTCKIKSEDFEKDVIRFSKICRVVKGLSTARIGVIGTRPAGFQTVRYSEKILQATGITVVPVGMSDILADAARIDTESGEFKQMLEDIRGYGTIPSSIPEESIIKQAKFSVAAGNWIKANEIDTATFQCWTALEENFGCAGCLTMSMLGENLLPSACEVDVCGAISMYAITLATGKPSALLDWNNNFAEDRNKCVCTHCSNYPKSFVQNPIEISSLDVLGASIGTEKCFGAIKGKVAAGPFTYFRISTDDTNGRIKGYVGEGSYTDDPYAMDGGIAVCKIDNLQSLLKMMCKNGFEHHVGMGRDSVSDIILEATDNYLGWDIYKHE